MAQRWLGVAAGGRRRKAGLACVLVLATALSLARPAAAQTLVVGVACVQQCGAVSRLVRENRPEVQACLIRCNATQDYDHATRAVRAQQKLPPSSPRSRPAAPAEARRPAPPAMSHAAVPAPAGSYPASTPPGSIIGSPRSLPQASPGPDRASALAMAAAAGTATAAVPGTRRWGAAYLAPAPATDFGLTVGLVDRLTAHAQAQAACGGRGVACRAALEFTDRCGAVAQARQTLGLFRTADPRTYSVSYAAAGSGTTREAAEAIALEECRARERATGCEVVASSCGRP